MHFVNYDREKSCAYAKEWAFKRNSAYYNFDGIGGDCTNFASQCLYAGIQVMNDTKDVGWYYYSPDDRAAAWTEANYFRRFMLTNTSVGPMGSARSPDELEIGDFISLYNGFVYYHTLIVVSFYGNIPLVATHTDDAYMRRLDSYHFTSADGIHILGGNRI